MSESERDQASSRQGSTFTRIVGDRHFLIAAVVMLVVAIGWPAVVRALKWSLIKRPVPWPDEVRVNEHFQNVGFAKSLGGRYRLIEEDGVFGGKKDGEPDGEIRHEDATLEALNVGTSLDEERIDERKSNWYVSRIYREFTPDGKPTPKLWQLSLTYYTGGLDRVPHVPEVCLQAGGATLVEAGDLTVHYPEAQAPWNEPFSVRRTVYEMKDAQTGKTVRYATFYVFSINGKPSSDWKRVRLELTYPWVEYCYFAKMQFGPRWPLEDSDDVDLLAKEFLKEALPASLKALPSVEEINRLEAQDS